VSALPSLDEAQTPRLLVDGPTLVRNVAAMAERVQSTGVELWPHCKTHKTPEIAALQREHGAAGLTVATVREAEVFAAAGHADLLVVYPPVGRARLGRLTELARTVRVRVVLDSEAALAGLDDACLQAGVDIGWLWEVDSGTRRIGTPPGATTAELVAPLATRYRHATFAGVLTFAGHAYGAQTPDELRAIAAAERAAVRDTAGELEALGVEAPARSVGTTPTAHQLEAPEGVTEIRPGNYVFYDATQVALGLVTEERCALSVLATVVARPDPRRLILDCGSKALAAERLTTRTPGLGLVAGHDELVVDRLFEEHAIVESSQPSAIPIGARLRVIPNHSCATANLHERMLITEGADVVDEWRIAARGWGRANESE
jgi:D-serine deaminase-like pyridoxal phosphate-dependent protein